MITDLVARAVERGGLPVDDVITIAIPLLEQVALTHEGGQVAPLRGLDALTVEDDRLMFDRAAATSPRLRRRAVVDAQAPHFVAGWQRWEHQQQHHDELTDIGSLGELLTALCCGLDLSQPRDVAELARHHSNLFALAPGLPPVVAAVLTSMLEPDRHRRAQDLTDLIVRLASYRDQPEDFDLGRVLAAGAGGQDRRAAVLSHLRERLFDLSRRNQLLHFRPTQQTLNLTEASVPLVLDVRSVRPAQLFTWGGPAARRLVAGRPVDAGALIRWDDAPYAFGALDAIISTARRDRAEFGRDQLRLVVAFLRWHNLEDEPLALVSSPLVLAPAIVTKKRGVRDSYRIELAGSEAEVNPVLRHQLRELYGFTLPQTVDLADPDAVDTLRSDIERQAAASQPGITVTLVDRPRIELIRSRAQTARQSYRRRHGGGRPSIGQRHYDYSYARPGWVPLGIQIFRDQVLRAPLPLSVELGDAPSLRPTATPEITGARPADGVVDQVVSGLDRPGRTNPYVWAVDLCSVTLANFNYRTLSLVGDYDALLAHNVPNAGFDELFSTAPREPADHGVSLEVQDRYLVVPADGSQVAALAQARAADNFVIQGPPGTGKSQTITNLIADYVARGQRVLFVCQKRAALDVVHARLRSQGLDEICTLVHDSQQDKRSFVHGLRDTYQAWQDRDAGLDQAEAERRGLVAELSAVHTEITGHDAVLLDPAADGRLVDLLDRAVTLRDSRWGDDLDPAARRLLPGPAAWTTARPAVDRLVAALGRAGPATTLAASPVRLVDPQVLAQPRAESVVAQRAGGLVSTLRTIQARLSSGSPALTLPQVGEVARLHTLLDRLARHGRRSVLEPRSEAATGLRRALADQRDAEALAERSAAFAAEWRRPPPAAEAREALEVARRREASLLRIFSGEWRRVRELVAAGFTTTDPAIPASQALGLLVARYEAEEAVAAARRRAEDDWGHSDLTALEAELGWARRVDKAVARWRDRLAGPADDALEALDDLPGLLDDVRSALVGTFEVGDLTLEEIGDALATLADPGGAGLIRAAAPALGELAALGDPEVLTALRVLDAPADALEYAVLAAAIADRAATVSGLDRMDGRRLHELLDRAGELVPRLEQANARVVTARLQDRFRAAVELSRRSVSGMSPADRSQKKNWSTGRRELEHEFGKVRAYRSIRQLASAESGAVVAALRPVWLMSPSSLSDTLPLESTFDVVIFDEASQIPVEEAVPALHRAAQVIVVGDRSQLPPTRYFQTRTEDRPEAARDDPDDDSARIGVVLEADSFLAVSSERLPSTMLSWHYRSRYEALIQFSNAAFYDGRLATIPDRVPQAPDRPPLHVSTADPPSDSAVADLVDAVLERSISLVRVDDGVYERRTNPAEARWIAHLVRDLLRRETQLTLGVVAFSEAQQSEIERALEQLAREDADFDTRYDAELRREDDGQTVGLFVKNLENVQGDERDVIIMSVCYAPAADGRMRMNFGPINHNGGEKRLNVIFSRSRQHMVLFSSIDDTAITNVYNDGANTLKSFLKYAAAVSTGDTRNAQLTLAGLRDGTGVLAESAPTPAIVSQIAAALAARGLVVAVDVGQSGFRCDVAVRPPAATAYVTAVLVDHPGRVGGAPAAERRLTQPAALAFAGWRVEQVTALEWLERPDDVVQRIVASVTGVGPL